MDELEKADLWRAIRHAKLSDVDIELVLNIAYRHGVVAGMLRLAELRAARRSA